MDTLATIAEFRAQANFLTLTTAEAVLTPFLTEGADRLVEWVGQDNYGLALADKTAGADTVLLRKLKSAEIHLATMYSLQSLGRSLFASGGFAQSSNSQDGQTSVTTSFKTINDIGTEEDRLLSRARQKALNYMTATSPSIPISDNLSDHVDDDLTSDDVRYYGG